MSKPSSKPRNTLERALRRPPEGDGAHPTLEAPPPTEGENTESRLARRVDAFLNTLVADQSGIVCDIEASPGATIAPRGRSSTERDAALKRLRDRKSLPVKLEGLLGEGGMGAVYLAEQTSLARKVAVKKIRAEVMSDDAVLKLLQEAWVTGHLEHPNIIPVYDIHTDAQGHPEIVLKRIDGVEWGELMFDAATVRRRFGAKDLLEWNLGVLMHVCDALHFAHRRGILHRDVKPENVLIGELGEIYLADWGIAVGLDEAHRDIIPLAANVTHMAGTPCYMAPEMLGGDESRLGPATDVYLLGSVLYEVLADRPPHEGDKMRDIVESIIVGPPPLPDHVAPELARIVERAQASDPDARFENPLQLRLALEGFLRHRGARSLAEHAEARRVEFTALAEDYAARFVAEAGEQAEDPTGAAASEARTALETSFAECRFGFREAIKQWPGNQPAKEGLARALTTMIEHELRIGDAKAARSLLTSFDDAVPPSDELASRVDVAEGEAKREAARMAQLERLHDERTGMRTRTFIAALLGAVWVVLPIALYFAQRGMDPNDLPDFRVVIAVPIVMLVLMTGLVIWARETFTSTVLNRRYAASLFFLFFVQLGLAFFLQAEQWSLHRTGIAHFAWWGVASGFGAILLDLRFTLAAAAYLVSVPLVVANPHAFYPCASLSNLLVTVIMVKMGLPVLRDDLQRRLAERAERRSGQG